MDNVKAILLAAGEGTRMKSKKPKVLHEIYGQPMVSYVISAARDCGAQQVCVVIGHRASLVQEALSSDKEIQFVLQQQQLGTGHAVMQAIDFIEDTMDIIVLYGDTPLITAKTLSEFITFHRNHKNAASVISAYVDDPTGYGRVVRDEHGKFLKIVEHKDADKSQLKIQEINTGIYCFQGKVLKTALSGLTNQNVQGEYYLPDTLFLIQKAGGNINAFVAEDASEFLGVNTRQQLFEATQIMKNKINQTLMENGVTLVDPQNTYIAPDTEIGIDTVILPGCVIEQGTKIGEDCIIGPNARLSHMTLADHVTFQASTGFDSSIGAYTNVGPYAYIRPNSHIGKKVKIGDFVEVKNSTIGDNTKVSHLTYIGDTDAGSGINFGCGTVTVNYDGKQKYRTVIEDNVFIGCNANLIAPVTIKKGSYIAAGSTITKDVPEDALAVARARQQAIEGWVKRRQK